MMFIAFEGPDLVGKTTQAKLLVDRLRSAGHEVFHLVSPGKDDFGNAARSCLLVRNLPLGERTHAVVTQACMIADRYAAMPEIERQLARGRIVVADRWTTSGRVYGEADGLEPQLLVDSQQHLVAPDLEIVLTAPIDVIQARARARGALDRYESDIDFLRRVLLGYDRCRQEPSPPRMFYNGDADRDGLAGQIWGVVATYLRRRWA
jgi:dTMP kinase